MLVKTMSALIAASSLPRVVSTSRSVPLVPVGTLEKEMIQQTASGCSALLGDLLQRTPSPLERDLQSLRRAASDAQTAAATAFVPSVCGDAAHDALHEFRQSVRVTFVLEPLGRHAQVQRIGFAFLRVRRGLLHEIDQRVFERRRLFEAQLRRASHSRMNEGRQHRVVARDAEALQVVKRSSDALRRQTSRDDQIVRRDAVVGIRVEKDLANLEQLGSVGTRYTNPRESGPRFVHRSHTQRRRENLDPVLLPSQQHRLLQPCDGGSDPGVVGTRIALERVLIILTQNLAGGGDHLAFQTLLAVQIAKRSEDAVDLSTSETRTGRHAELALDIVHGVKKHATGFAQVTAGPARFLQVVLEGTGNVGVDHDPHIRLVYTHAERVGRGDHSQIAPG